MRQGFDSPHSPTKLNPPIVILTSGVFGRPLFLRANSEARSGLQSSELYAAYINVQSQRMAKRSTGARFNLGEPWDSDLADFLVAHFGGSATEVVRTALRAFIDDQLAKDPESKKRFDEARRKRLGLNGDKIRLLPTSK